MHRISTSKNSIGIVLCHGITYSSIPDFFTLIEETPFAGYLYESGYNVYACDYLGYGKSTKVRNDVNLMSAVKTVKGVVDYILEIEGLEGIAVMGWSWGAHVAGHFCSLFYDTRIISLILYGYCWRYPILRINSDLTKRRRKNSIGHAMSDFYCIDQNISDVIERYVRKALEVDPTSPVGPRREIVDQTIPIVSPESIKCPTLVVHGIRDKNVDNSIIGEFYDRLKVRKEYHRIVGGHAVHLERGYKDLIGIISRFIYKQQMSDQ